METKDIIYVQVPNIVHTYRHKDGSWGAPSDEKASEAAVAALSLSTDELLAPHTALLCLQERSHKWPLESEPVDVYGYDAPVVFHMSVTWEDFDREAAQAVRH